MHYSIQSVACNAAKLTAKTFNLSDIQVTSPPLSQFLPCLLMAFNLELRQLRPGKTKLLYKSIITVSRQLLPVSQSAQKHFSKPFWMHLVNGALKSSAFPMAMWQTQVTDERALMSVLLWEKHRTALLHRYGHESHGTVFLCVKVMPTGAAGGTEVLENQRQVASQTNTLDQHCLNRWTWLYSFTLP